MATYRATTFVYIASFCVFFSSRFRGTNSLLDVYFDELDGEIFLCSCCRIEDPHFDVVTQRNSQMLHEVSIREQQSLVSMQPSPSQSILPDRNCPVKWSTGMLGSAPVATVMADSQK